MKIINLLLCYGMAFGQGVQTSKHLQSGTVFVSQGVSVKYETRLEGIGGGTFKLQGGTKRNGGGIHSRGMVVSRYMYDDTKYVGYDLILEPVAGASEVRVTIAPLSLSARELQLEKEKVLQQVEIPHYPLPQVVPNGSTIALDLLVNHATGQKIVDYLTVSSKPMMSKQSEPRAFSMDDVVLEFRHPRLRVNALPVGEMSRTISGTSAWIYVPGRGRFAFSVGPKQGYEKVGMVEGNSLLFEWAGTKYEVACDAAIVAGGGNWFLYVRADESYRATGPAASEFHVGATN